MTEHSVHNFNGTLIHSCNPGRITPVATGGNPTAIRAARDYHLRRVEWAERKGDPTPSVTTLTSSSASTPHSLR